MTLKIFAVLLFINFVTGNIDYLAPTSTFGRPCPWNDCPEGLTCKYSLRKNENICSCPSPFQRYVNGKCRGIPGASCDPSNQFACIADAKCNATIRQCDCVEGKTTDISFQNCINKIGSPCGVPINCASNPPSFCSPITNRCTCAPAAYGMIGECFKTYGDTCQNNDECNGSPWMNLACLGGKCGCTDGREFNKEFEIMGNPAKGRCEFKLGARCSVNGEHFGACSSGAMCSVQTGLCACGKYSKLVNGECSCVSGAYRDSVESPCFCFEGSTGLISTNECACPMTMYANAFRRRCEPCPADAILDRATKSCVCQRPSTTFNVQTNSCL